jgi:hypothetical protein
VEVEFMNDKQKIVDEVVNRVKRSCTFFYPDTISLIRKIYYKYKDFDSDPKAKADFMSRISEPSKHSSFPFPTAYIGQNAAIDELVNSINPIITLRSPTGTGKTPVYLTALSECLDLGMRSLVITPRKDLQDQLVREYHNHFAKLGMPIYELKRREEYCKELPEPRLDTDKRGNKIAACRARYKRKGRWFFEYKGVEYEYPCKDCLFEAQKEKALTMYRKREALLTLNPGNYYYIYGEIEDEKLYPDVVVVDEADVFRNIVTQSVTIRRRMLEIVQDHRGELTSEQNRVLDKLAKNEELSQDDVVCLLNAIAEGLLHEAECVEEQLEMADDPVRFPKEKLRELNNWLDELRSARRRVLKFTQWPDRIFHYWEGKNIVVEAYLESDEFFMKVFPEPHVEKRIIVSATAPKTNYKIVSFDVEFPFAKIISVPIANFTYTSVFKNPISFEEDENQAIAVLDTVFSNFIHPVSLEVGKLLGYDTNVPTPIFTGAMRFNDKMDVVFRKNGVKRYLIHREGNLNEIVKEFLTHRYDYIALARGAEHGGNWHQFPFMYILRTPFRDVTTPREKAFRKFLGNEDVWREDYEWDALSCLMQACGRNARHPTSFAVSVILDKKFNQVYESIKARNPSLIPEWFRKRLVFLREENGKVVWYDDFGRPFTI